MTKTEGETSPPNRDKLIVDEPAVLQELCGDSNRRIKLVERSTGATVHVRGNELIFEGDKLDVELAKEVLSQMLGLVKRGAPIDGDDISRAVDMLKADHKSDLRDVFHDVVLVPKRGRPIAPKSVAQKRYIDAVKQNDVVFAIGPAGTGKTFLAMAQAVRLLVEKQIKRIVLTRPAVEAGEKLGFLPGTLEEKVNPYLRPLYDALFDMLEPDKARALVEDGVIEVAPLAFMRGRTLADSFVILDEAQNTTCEQMKMFLTRLGMGSRAVVTGDLSQSDLPRGTKPGLRDAVDVLRNVEGVKFCYLSEVDVVRHRVVRAIIRAYDARDEANPQR